MSATRILAIQMFDSGRAKIYTNNVYYPILFRESFQGYTIDKKYLDVPEMVKKIENAFQRIVIENDVRYYFHSSLSEIEVLCNLYLNDWCSQNIEE